MSFRIVGGRKIEQVRRARILYTIHPYNPDRATDYSAGLMAALRRIESGGNTLLPSADEAEWWENKVFMHRRFDALGIHCPITTIIDADDHLDADSFSYPLLAKEPHSSGSMGVHKVESADELRAIHTRLHAEGKPELLVQELIDMGRDFRATCVGDEVVHHYFRINTADEWQPTSTSRGSVVDFETFPEQWRSYITDVIVKCGLRTGAFDICWSGDDLSTEPYILEVSPSYTPNPPPPTSFGDRPYYEFKKQLTGPDAFSRAFIQTVVEITRAMLDVYDIR